MSFAADLRGCRRVLVLGGYGCGNLGDEAILSVLLRELAVVDVAVRVVSADPVQTMQTHHVASVAPQPRALIQAIAWSDAIVIGGGGIFSGYMGSRSRFLPIVALAASLGRRRVLFRALGVYPSTPRPVLRLLAAAMSRARFVSVRDETSRATLVAAGVRRWVQVEPDPGWRVYPEPINAPLPSPNVGLALRRLRDVKAQRALDVRFVELLNGLIGRGQTPALLPFCDHPSEYAEQDVAYAEFIRSRCVDPSAVQIVRAQRPGQMLGVIQRLDVLVAMRFHAIVFGAAANVPMIALPYDDKCHDFVQEHDIPSLSLNPLDVTEVLASLKPEETRVHCVQREVAA